MDRQTWSDMGNTEQVKLRGAGDPLDIGRGRGLCSSFTIVSFKISFVA